MKRTLLVALVVAILGACNSQPTVVKFCLGEDGTSQDCGIACKVTQDKASCDKWAKKTKEICGKITRAECQQICEKDENPVACELAKKM